MVRLKVGEKQSLIVQDFQTLASLMAQILGSPDGSGDSSKSQQSKPFEPKNAAELHMAFNSVFGNV